MMTTKDLALSKIPEGLRDELISEYNKIVKNFRERRWEPTELDGARFCEVVYSVVSGLIAGTFPKKAAKPGNFLEACNALANADSKRFPKAVRIQIPKALIVLYEIRNNRGVGHVGGDVDSNHMDATLVISVAKWLLCELVRIFHDTDTESATKTVESITERELPIVWKTASGKLRALPKGLSKKSETLLLLFHSPTSLHEDQLLEWTEHSNPSIYRRDVLRSLHQGRLVEYDRKTLRVELSPKGVAEVEELILPRVEQ